jgi:TPR repeat protein
VLGHVCARLRHDRAVYVGVGEKLGFTLKSVVQDSTRKTKRLPLATEKQRNPSSFVSLSFSLPHPPRALQSRQAPPQGTSTPRQRCTFDRSAKVQLTGAKGLYAADMAPSEVAKRLRKGAGKGSADDQLEFGLLHHRGTEGVKRNLPTAAEWIKKVATQGLAAAQAFLGELYARGEGVERDAEQAVAWWRKAATQVDQKTDAERKFILQAQRHLAKAYDDGGAHAGAPFQLDSEQYLPASHFMPSCLQYLTCALPLKSHVKLFLYSNKALVNGVGVAQDFVMAAEWYRKAAAGGCVVSRNQLGEMYYFGKEGVEQDFARAVAEFRRAEEEEGEEGGGHAPTQRFLAFCYYHGQGVEKDHVQALAWYKKAGHGGRRP